MFGFTSISALRHAAIKWAKYYVYFTKAAFFLLGLVFGHGLVKNAVVDSLMIYIGEENWGLAKSAAAVNTQEAIVAILTIVNAHVADAWGLVLLYFFQKTKLLLVSLLLVASGFAGREPTFRAFFADQFTGQDESQLEARSSFWWYVVKFVGAAISVFLITQKSWRSTFKISAIVMGAAYLWFLFGARMRLYNCHGPTTSPVTTLYKVFKAAIRKRCHDFPDTPDGYYMNQGREIPHSPCHPILRWMDKAAIQTNEAEVEGNYLCRAAEVKNAKRLLTMLPLWMTFLIYGMVQAAGSTFFIEQSNGMDVYINDNFDFPITAFFILESLTRDLTSYLVNFLISKICRVEGKQPAQLVKINAGMFFSILCCIAAWQVEVHRFKVVKEHNLLNSEEDDDYKIPMTIFSLVPQFLLLGVMTGLAEDGLSEFYCNHVDESMKQFDEPFNGLLIGVGKVFTVFFILIRSTSWFGDTINHSRLDKYFRWLMILSCCNLYFCVLVSYAYVRLQSQQHDENIQNQSLEPP
ncbi:protein NRT1/ PTR FAMILY 8.2 isoform X2 [Ricinus communis]|uniref:protein NRT1/ PTR FAMILY 8.2 isoform X2 n=1 Tax=Ricinus communis TaxID=3988 RepID=UPI000D6951CD|nr:protein NRT1/ PTR FAMILY 8.2 isoform X2 [Ricinus communis]|eukprot:XP_025014053.1 protein NRT1/ PTR FAMILY 8.2 isoform X2 [Ricinus communis]